MPATPARADTPDSAASFATARTSHTAWRLSSPDLAFAPIPVRLWRVSPAPAGPGVSADPQPKPKPLPPTPSGQAVPPSSGEPDAEQGAHHTGHHPPPPPPPPPPRPSPTRPPMRRNARRISTGQPTTPPPHIFTEMEPDTKHRQTQNGNGAEDEHVNRPAPSPGTRGYHAPAQSRSAAADISLYILAFFIPPLAVALRVGCGFEVFLDVILWILCWIPGVLYAFYIIASRPHM